MHIREGNGSEVREASRPTSLCQRAGHRRSPRSKIIKDATVTDGQSVTTKFTYRDYLQTLDGERSELLDGPLREGARIGATLLRSTDVVLARMDFVQSDL